MSWRESAMHEYDWIAVPHQHKKQFGVMVKVPDS